MASYAKAEKARTRNVNGLAERRLVRGEDRKVARRRACATTISQSSQCRFALNGQAARFLNQHQAAAKYVIDVIHGCGVSFGVSGVIIDGQQLRTRQATSHGVP